MTEKFNNNMHGALFPNDKGDNPKRPDYRGNCDINGVKYWISGWVAYSPTRVRYMSLKFEKQEPRASPPPTANLPFNDDIPF